MSLDLPPDWWSGRSAWTSAREQEKGAKGYVCPDVAKAAVHAALHLGEALLLTGEPGTGKTQLAYWLADQLGTKLHRFQTQSGSQARDLRYRYDELRRFRDAYRQDPQQESAYVTPGPLWAAIEGSRLDKRPHVLLIDEIDKAPRDFPNDLLDDLDQMRFVVPELGTTIRVEDPDLRPILVITSNLERELPRAFLRRCCYCQLPFDAEVVKTALNARAAELGAPSPAFLELAVTAFMKVRNDLAKREKPATAEALMWVRALQRFGATEADLRKPVKELPYLELLIKSHEKWETLRRDG